MPRVKQLVVRCDVGQSNVPFAIRGKGTDPLVLSGSLLAGNLLVWEAGAGEGDALESRVWKSQWGRNLETQRVQSGDSLACSEMPF